MNSHNDSRSRFCPKYSLGSVLNHVLLHQTIIGQEAVLQLAKAGESGADLVIGCAGGGSNFAGLSFPFLRENLAGTQNAQIIAVELGVVLGHGFGLTLSTLAEAAVAAVSEAVIDGCEAVGPLKMAGDVVVDPARLDAGVLRLPDPAGRAASIEPAALERYRVHL